MLILQEAWNPSEKNLLWTASFHPERNKKINPTNNIPLSSGSANEENLCLFFSLSPSTLFSHPQGFCVLLLILGSCSIGIQGCCQWQTLEQEPAGLAVRLWLSSWASDHSSGLLNFLFYHWSSMRGNYKPLWKLYTVCSLSLPRASLPLFLCPFSSLCQPKG